MLSVSLFFFLNHTATTEIYTLSLHDALPISTTYSSSSNALRMTTLVIRPASAAWRAVSRSEEHTSELQSRQYLVCRLLLEKKKKTETSAFLIARSTGLDRALQPVTQVLTSMD